MCVCARLYTYIYIHISCRILVIDMSYVTDMIMVIHSHPQKR